MQLSTPPNLRTEDFPDQKSWIARLFIQLNPFFLQTQQAVNQIDYTNIESITRELSYANVQFPIKLQWTFESTPMSCQILSAKKGTEQTPTVLVPVWTYDASSKTISVTKMYEITDGGTVLAQGQYKLVMRISI
jgi:hypothetical protein